jgi:outer membrane protein X
MKNITKTFTLCLAIMAGLAFTNAAQAQDKTAGLGLVYGTGIESAGIQLNGQYFLTENWAITPSFVFFFPKEAFRDYKMKWYDVNLNASYYFDLENETIRPYATAGINIALVSVPTYDFDFWTGSSGDVKNETYSEVGLGLGGGADFMVTESLIPFGELRYSLSGYDQLSIVGGVRFKF